LLIDCRGTERGNDGHKKEEDMGGSHGRQR
jgi:hypothetical protein